MTKASRSGSDGSRTTLPEGTSSASVAARLPNLIIAGVTKAGTTSLFRYLAQHPDVCPADEKELRYFLPRRYGEPLGPLEDYARHFRHCGGQRYAMEASPGYFYGGRVVAGALSGTLDQPKVLILLREPGERCFSFFNFMRSRAQLPQQMTFDSYLDRCEALHADGVDQLRENHPFSGLGAGCYAQWLEPWLETFGDQLRIEFFDDLVADPAGTVGRLCAWLGIDVAIAAGLQYHVENKTEQFRVKRLQQAALSWNRAHVLFFERHQGIKRVLRRLYYLLNRAPSARRPSFAARQRLDAFYAPHNDRLAALLPGDRAPRWLRRPD